MVGEVGVIASEVGHIEAGVVWPEICVGKMNLPERPATAANDDSWSFGYSRIVESVLSGGTHDRDVSRFAFVRSQVVTSLKRHKVSQGDVFPISVHDSLACDRRDAGRDRPPGGP